MLGDKIIFEMCWSCHVQSHQEIVNDLELECLQCGNTNRYEHVVSETECKQSMMQHEDTL